MSGRSRHCILPAWWALFTVFLILGCIGDEDLTFNPTLIDVETFYRFDAAFTHQLGASMSVTVPARLLPPGRSLTLAQVKPDSLPRSEIRTPIAALSLSSDKRTNLSNGLEVIFAPSKADRHVRVVFWHPHARGSDRGSWIEPAQVELLSEGRLKVPINTLEPFPGHPQALLVPLVLALVETLPPRDEPYCTTSIGSRELALCTHLQKTLPELLLDQILDTGNPDFSGLHLILDAQLTSDTTLSLRHGPRKLRLPRYTPYRLEPLTPTATLHVPRFGPDFPALDARKNLPIERVALYERVFALHVLHVLEEATFSELWTDFEQAPSLWGDTLDNPTQAFVEDFCDFLALYLLILQEHPARTDLENRVERSPRDAQGKRRFSLIESARNSEDFRRVKGLGLLILWDLFDNTPEEDPYAGSLTELLRLIFERKPRNLVEFFFDLATSTSRFSSDPRTTKRLNSLQRVYVLNNFFWMQSVVVEDRKRQRLRDVRFTLLTAGHALEPGPVVLEDTHRSSDDFAVHEFPISLGNYVLEVKDHSGNLLGRCELGIDEAWGSTHETSAFKEILYVSPCFPGCRPSLADLNRTTRCD
ncbi:MAG: hypothetical protein A2284_14255 [Deltaproteobacteria bacterium RIFOXYA12_FULL_61_11]|nr:MAG: hypothetical protein A2284_14255 [Deltaproteobacteria bacterium RIFOXYA12_FULL_61_11]